MEDRVASVLRTASLVALGAALWTVSFSWLALGPASSALMGASWLVVSVACGVTAILTTDRTTDGHRSSRHHLALDALRRHRSAVAVVALSMLTVAGLASSAAYHAEPSYLDGRIVSLVRLTILFGLAHLAVSLVAHGRSVDLALRAPLVAPAVVLAIIAVIAWLYVRADMHPLDAYEEAVRTGRFEPVLTSIRLIHADLGDRILGSTVRHLEIRGAICASFLGLALARERTWRSVGWPLLALCLATLLAFVQFSRANLLIVALALTAPALVALVRVGTRVRLVIVGSVLAAVVVMVQIDAVTDALFDGSNRSSEVRGEAFTDAVVLLDDAMPLGITGAEFRRDLQRSPHNMLLDLTLGAGILGTLAAAGLIALASWHLVGAFRRQAAAVTVLDALPTLGLSGLLLIVLVRMLTGGGGLLDPVSWIAFGSALAVEAVRSPEAERPAVVRSST